jgi:hypothetical protein
MKFNALRLAVLFCAVLSALTSGDIVENFATTTNETICDASIESPVVLPVSLLKWGGYSAASTVSYTGKIRTRDTGGVRFYAGLSDDANSSANSSGSYIYTLFDSSTVVPDSIDLGSVEITSMDAASNQKLRLLVRDAGGDWFISGQTVDIGYNETVTAYIEILDWLAVDSTAAAEMNNLDADAKTPIADISGLSSATLDASSVTGGGLYIDQGDQNASAMESFIVSSIVWGEYQELTLAQRVEALPESSDAEKLKKALLEWGLEDAQLDEDAGNAAAAQTTRDDVQSLLDADIGQPAPAQTRYYPNIPDFSNNFIAANAVSRMAQIRSVADTYPRGGELPFVFERTLADRMFMMAQAIGHPQSPYLADPQCLKVMLRNMQRIYDLADEQDRLDFFAYPGAGLSYLLFSSRYPDMFLPSKKSEWEQTLQTRIPGSDDYTFDGTEVGVSWVNRDVQFMTFLLAAAEIFDDQSFAGKADDCLTMLENSIYPDGAFPYIWSQNESFNYHGIAPHQIMYYRLIADSQRALELLEKGYWYYPLTTRYGPMGEYYTSPSWKQTWNLQDGSAAAYITASVTGSQDNYRVAMQGWNANGEGSELYNWSDFFLASFYRSDLTSRPEPDNYFVYDRNIMGPRGRFGNFSFGATANLFSDNPGTFSERGMKTFVGCEIVNGVPGWDLNSGVTAVCPRYRVRMGVSIDAISDQEKWNPYHIMLSRNEKSASIVDADFASLSTSYTLTKYSDSNLKPWRGKQQWLFLPDAMVGKVSIEALSDTEAYGLSVAVKTISGRITWGTKKEFEQLDESTWKYGELIVKVLEHDMHDIKTQYASTSGVTEDPAYQKCGRVVVRDQNESQADALWQQWLDDGQPGEEPDPGKTLYPADSGGYAIVAVYPQTSVGAVAHMLNLSEGLSGFETSSLDDNSNLVKYRVIHNTSAQSINYSTILDWQGRIMLHRSGQIYRPDWLSEYDTSDFDDFRQSPLSGHTEPQQVNPANISVDIPANTHIVIRQTISNCPQLTADLDRDCLVTMTDFAKLCSQWLKCTEPYSQDCDDLR